MSALRGFEQDGERCRAAASLAELRGSAQLRQWFGYREIGSVYLLSPGTDVTEQVDTIERLLPGSVAVVTGTGLFRYPFRDLPDGTIGIVERQAGYLAGDHAGHEPGLRTRRIQYSVQPAVTGRVQ